MESATTDKQLHPHALFSLVPVNDAARAVLQISENRPRVSTFEDPDGSPVQGIEVGFHLPSRLSDPDTLAVLSRYGDIALSPERIAPRHGWRFKMEDFRVVLIDESGNGSAQFIGTNAPVFGAAEGGRQLKAILTTEVRPYLVELGTDSPWEFEIRWHRDNVELGKLGVIYRWAARSDMETLVRAGPIDYTPLAPAGVDSQTGEWISVLRPRNQQRLMMKSWAFPPAMSPRELGGEVQRWRARFRAILGVEHANLVTHIGDRCGTDYKVFIADIPSARLLEPGALADAHDTAFSHLFLYQGLRAIKYLAERSIFHGHIRPESIFCTHLFQKRNQYRLGDFPLSQRPLRERAQGGPFYVAWEVHECGEGPTEKSDIWSLAMAYLSVFDVGGFCSKRHETLSDTYNAALSAISGYRHRHVLNDMLQWGPGDRPPAAVLLEQHFRERG